MNEDEKTTRLGILHDLLRCLEDSTLVKLELKQDLAAKVANDLGRLISRTAESR